MIDEGFLLDTGFPNFTKIFGPSLARNPCLCLLYEMPRGVLKLHTDTAPTSTLHSASTNQQLFHAHGFGRSLKTFAPDHSPLTARDHQDTQRRCHPQARWRTTRKSRRLGRVSKELSPSSGPHSIKSLGTTCIMNLPSTGAN